ncbi:MAG: ATP citrate synthase [Deltaproteobacteria bacterium]|nr:ATP citrate synthase [Deltaproteobacteria bacterium]
MNDYDLYDKNTQAIIYGSQVNAVQRMLDFDYLCGREKPSVAAIVNPNRESLVKVFFSQHEIMVPEYKSLEKAAAEHPEAHVMINFSSFRSAFATSKEALETDSIKVVVIIAEGIPERDTRKLIALAKKNGKTIVGPATVGGIKAGGFKIGNTAGKIDNIIASKLFRPGSVGVVSKSGGLSNEIYNIVALNADGINEGVAIGGDRWPGSDYLDHLLRYETNPDIKFMVALGEIGGRDEYEIIDAIKAKKITKPLIMWVSGTCAKMFSSGVQFGHAGAASGADEESAQAKNQALREAGVIVPNSFDDFGEKVKETYERLKAEGAIKEEELPSVPKFPVPLKEALSTGMVRKPTSFTCTISDDRGDEPVYAGYTISEILEKGWGIGDVISLLWFKRPLPEFATKFFELVIVVSADHGPAVSGAHNATVTARAGKDMVSALASGLLTIGPRFGGAINDAAIYFKEAVDRGLTAKEFVTEMKDKGINIPGIGHRVKSVQNPDKRVEILSDYAKKNFPSTEYLDFARKVEALTTEKRNNLILNVDGCIAVVFLDLLASGNVFSESESREIVKLGYLNGFFVVARSIGMIGHIMDQYRLKKGLYRHPTDDILYDVQKMD